MKRKLRTEIAKLLSEEQMKRASRDSHARRIPRPCGFTIHTGTGCSLRCAYCYIETMGFMWSTKSYPLSSLELIYALLLNPYFIPGRYGSLIAIGSVTEPFHGLVRDKTFDFINKSYKYLGNPVQFSTKMYLSIRDANKICSVSPLVSPLITIITLKYAKKLEPLSPPPHKRLETIRNLKSQGLEPFLFLRPIIPGLIEDEYEYLLEKAVEYGAVGVVVGSLRVSLNILKRLEESGVPVNEIYRRMLRRPRGREQVLVDTRDLKSSILRYAEKLGLLAFPEACLANLYTHRITCWKMLKLGILRGGQPPPLRKNIVYEVADALDVPVEDVSIKEYRVKVYVSSSTHKSILLKEILHSRLRACIDIRRV